MISARTSDGRFVKINFQHYRKTLMAVGRDALATDLTRCDIIEGPRTDEQVIASGKAFCSIQDNFSKEHGRQLALKRAIRQFDRETQGSLLNAYFSRRKQQPKTQFAEDTY